MANVVRYSDRVDAYDYQHPCFLTMRQIQPGVNLGLERFLFGEFGEERSWRVIQPFSEQGIVDTFGLKKLHVYSLFLF